MRLASLAGKLNLQVYLFNLYDGFMAAKGFDAAINEFTHSIGMLVRRARAAAASEELSWSESSVLKRLARAGAATTAELARLEGMRPQSMRTIVASLEKMRMVKRRPHATDGRQVNLELTARGAAAQKSSGEARQGWLTRTFEGLTAEERETLFAAGRILRRSLEGDPQ